MMWKCGIEPSSLCLTDCHCLEMCLRNTKREELAVKERKGQRGNVSIQALRRHPWGEKRGSIALLGPEGRFKGGTDGGGRPSIGVIGVTAALRNDGAAAPLRVRRCPRRRIAWPAADTGAP